MPSMQDLALTCPTSEDIGSVWSALQIFTSLFEQGLVQAMAGTIPCYRTGSKCCSLALEFFGMLGIILSTVVTLPTFSIVYYLEPEFSR